MFLCWSTVLPVLPSILHIPSIGELLTNSTRQGWLSGTGRSYLWHHPDSGCPWTWMPMDIPSRFKSQVKITSEVWTTTAQRALNVEISGITRCRMIRGVMWSCKCWQICLKIRTSGGPIKSWIHFGWVYLPFGSLTCLSKEHTQKLLFE